VNGKSGVEVGTDIAWRYTNHAKTPTFFVVNQLDTEGANFDETYKQLVENYGEKVKLAQYPVNAGTSFDAIIDLMLNKLVKCPKGGGKAIIEDIPASEKDKAAKLYEELVEMAAAGSEELMEKYFDSGELTLDEFRKGIRLAMAAHSVCPVLCCSAKEDQGVARILEFISNNVSEPDVKPVTDAFSAFIFKTTHEAHLGEMSIMKVMSGEISKGLDIVNTKNGSKERVSQLLVVAGKNRIEVEKAVAGDLISTIKLKDAKTNSTLATAKNSSVSYETIVFPEPIFTTAIKAANSADDEKLGLALNELKAEDPSLRVEYSREVKQMIVQGMGEVHINTMKWYLNNAYKLQVELYAPKISYRETITKKAYAEYTHKKQSGGAGQFGKVCLIVEPYTEGEGDKTKFSHEGKEYPIKGKEEKEMAWGGKLVYHNCIVGGSIDAAFMPAILKGIMQRMEEAPLTGSFARDINVYVVDGKMHPVDSKEVAFILAGRHAFSIAFKNAGPKIMEPIYDVDVMMPADRMGDVMTDLQGRRAVVMGMDSEGKFQIIHAKVPLAEMNRYSTTLSSITSGRGTYSMKFASYEQVPADVQTALLKAYEAEQKEEE
jgi:elongation factor G